MAAPASEVTTSTSPLFVNIRKIGIQERPDINRRNSTEEERSPYNYEEWQVICSEVAAASRYDPQRLADLCAISLRQLERQFKAELNCTPRDWLNRRRMETAGALLARSNSVKEVAYSLSFKQPSHFTREFKEHFGVTPTQYRDLRISHRVRGGLRGVFPEREFARA